LKLDYNIHFIKSLMAYAVSYCSLSFKYSIVDAFMVNFFYDVWLH